MSAGHIEKEWRSFWAAVGPTTRVGREPMEAARRQRQHDEMEKAFYAGSLALFAVVMGQLSPGDEVEAVDLKLLSDIENELTEFGRKHGVEA